jgi:hypothetical protein
MDVIRAALGAAGALQPHPAARRVPPRHAREAPELPAAHQPLPAAASGLCVGFACFEIFFPFHQKLGLTLVM